MTKHIKSIAVLTIICAVVSLLLAATHFITSPIIAEQEKAKTNKALLVVYPDGGDFEQIDISKYKLPDTVIEAYQAENGGYAIKLNVTGYQPNMVILCGVDKYGVVTGATCISSGETLGKEQTYGENFVGKSSEDYDSVDTIANATYTTQGYKNAIKDALNAAIILGGGSADLRSEEEILKDNLSAALPSANGEFKPVFITEEIGDIQKVYASGNNTGFVFVISEKFIATDKDGKVLSQTDTDTKTKVETAAQAIINSHLNEIDITKYADMPVSIINAYKTDSGNFVFTLQAAGYGINGGDKYHPASGKPIVIKVSATKDGKIISCETIEQAETDGIGSACGDEKFYSQFNGKTESDYSQIDAISGATITTNGYVTAIGDVFNAIKILKGVS